MPFAKSTLVPLLLAVLVLLPSPSSAASVSKRASGSVEDNEDDLAQTLRQNLAGAHKVHTGSWLFDIMSSGGSDDEGEKGDGFASQEKSSSKQGLRKITFREFSVLKN